MGRSAVPGQKRSFLHRTKQTALKILILAGALFLMIQLTLTLTYLFATSVGLVIVTVQQIKAGMLADHIVAGIIGCVLTAAVSPFAIAAGESGLGTIFLFLAKIAFIFLVMVPATSLVVFLRGRKANGVSTSPFTFAAAILGLDFLISASIVPFLGVANIKDGIWLLILLEIPPAFSVIGIYWYGKLLDAITYHGTVGGLANFYKVIHNQR